MAAAADKVKVVLSKLQWMKEQKIWPNGLRYLWTDAHGVCALLSLYHETKDEEYIRQAESVIADVYKVLGRKKGLRIGEESDRDGQYYHYLTKWMYALGQMGKVKPEYHEKAVQLAKDIHKAFVRPGIGVHWKMLEDLSGPYPGFGLGGLDYYDGYVQYKLLDPSALNLEMLDMYNLIQKDYKQFSCTQDLGLGESLWMSHFFPEEPWAKVLRERSEKTLDTMWVEVSNDAGYFCRQPYYTDVKFAFTNFGVSYGLQAVGLWPERVQKLNNFFTAYKSHDDYDTKSEKMLDTMWVDHDASSGYFCREPRHRRVKFAFTNFGISYALTACKLWPSRVDKLNNFFETYKSQDEYDCDAITHVMHVNSLLPGVFVKGYNAA